MDELMFALRGEAVLHAAADWIVAIPGGGDGGASHGIGRGEVITGAFEAATLLGSARLEGAGMLDCWAKVAGTGACCCEPKWLLVAASVVAETVGPKWPGVELEPSSALEECVRSGTAHGGAEVALGGPPSDAAVAQAGMSPCSDCGRFEDVSRSSSSIVFFLRKGLKIFQSGNWRGLVCPNSGAWLHSCRGANSVEKAGASAECGDAEFDVFMLFWCIDAAKGGDACETGSCCGDS